ncbi:hypothetical protein FVE85_6568 [Porphyridium purpureum]|uniref:Uncharacterized protein n=1 Tax=Porphyridium purpureum TaxID=35688 RepID=A0A5J4Z825_PORPP|nr:hypothetical protein FVE85_6568 [Porphyridium purpureum]|eukprot:POR8165..scf295_1
MSFVARIRRQLRRMESTGKRTARSARESVKSPLKRGSASRVNETSRAKRPRQAFANPSTEGVPGHTLRDANGGIVFDDVPEFRPRLTPEQMIRRGVFGGCYFHPRGGKPGILYRGAQGIPGVTHEEFPAEWFQGLNPNMYRNRRYDSALNKYGVSSGQDQAEWERKGWIRPQDPRGWFQWYCRFFLGRRSEDDDRQISRWKGVAGPKGRWKRALLNKITRAGVQHDNESVSPVIRQTLLHWAFEVSEKDLQRHKL